LLLSLFLSEREWKKKQLLCERDDLKAWTECLLRRLSPLLLFFFFFFPSANARDGRAAQTCLSPRSCSLLFFPFSFSVTLTKVSEPSLTGQRGGACIHYSLSLPFFPTKEAMNHLGVRHQQQERVPFFFLPFFSFLPWDIKAESGLWSDSRTSSSPYVVRFPFPPPLSPFLTRETSGGSHSPRSRRPLPLFFFLPRATTPKRAPCRGAATALPPFFSFPFFLEKGTERTTVTFCRWRPLFLLPSSFSFLSQ